MQPGGSKGRGGGARGRVPGHPHAPARRQGTAVPPRALPRRARRRPGGHHRPGGLPLRLPHGRVPPHLRPDAGRPRLLAAVRDFVRVFRASAHPDTPDKQGRVTIPAAAARLRRASTRSARSSATAPGSRSGTPPPGTPTSPRSCPPTPSYSVDSRGGGPGAVTPRPAPHGQPPTPTPAHRPPTTRLPASSRPGSRRDFPRAGPGSDGDQPPGRPTATATDHRTPRRHATDHRPGGPR